MRGTLLKFAFSTCQSFRGSRKASGGSKVSTLWPLFGQALIRFPIERSARGGKPTHKALLRATNPLKESYALDEIGHCQDILIIIIR